MPTATVYNPRPTAAGSLPSMSLATSSGSSTPTPPNSPAHANAWRGLPATTPKPAGPSNSCHRPRGKRACSERRTELDPHHEWHISIQCRMPAVDPGDLGQVCGRVGAGGLAGDPPGRGKLVARYQVALSGKGAPWAPRSLPTRRVSRPGPTSPGSRRRRTSARRARRGRSGSPAASRRDRRARTRPEPGPRPRSIGISAVGPGPVAGLEGHHERQAGLC